jgi:predicted nucleic acid-binding Zn ribbon protein
MDTPSPRCALCGDPFWPEQAGQRYCSSRHREAAKKRRQRSRSDWEQLLVPSGTTLTELYTRATPPRHAVADDGHPDDEDNEHGYSDDGPGTWSDAWRLSEAVEAIRARYERLARPYLAQLRRNPGVRPAGLVELEQRCHDETAEMIRAHDHATQAGRARRHKPQRIMDAHERQAEQRAVQALASDLPGGSRRYEAPQYTGRVTRDLWRW